MTNVDGEVAVTNSNPIAVIEVRPTSPLSIFSKDTKDDSNRNDVGVKQAGNLFGTTG